VFVCSLDPIGADDGGLLARTNPSTLAQRKGVVVLAKGLDPSRTVSSDCVARTLRESSPARPLVDGEVLVVVDVVVVVVVVVAVDREEDLVQALMLLEIDRGRARTGTRTKSLRRAGKRGDEERLAGEKDNLCVSRVCVYEFSLSLSLSDNLY
jgi:hypothetical protein